MSIEDRFIKYVKIDTKSNEESKETPSTKIQFNLANLLCEELKEMGISNAYVTKECLVYAKIDGNLNKKTIGLIAHMDTSPELDGGNYSPRIIEKYDGKDIRLNDKYVLSPNEFPSLKNNINQKLIVTDGEHLLGGDDKAGISIIMEIANYYMTHKEIDHAPISICFTPDEEVGRGPENFDCKIMNADFAYTLDGGKYSDFSYENFNAFSAKVDIEGVSIHPGSAKGIMVNASLLAMEFNSLLPEDEVPSRTENYQGFYHLCSIEGDVNKATLYYIIRDHDLDKAKEKCDKLKEIETFLNKKYPKGNVKVEISESYRNMKECFKDNKEPIDRIIKAYKKCNIKYTISPIRGGTDGATITYMGLPCPNLGDGDYNCHGRFEYVSVDEMKKMVEVIKALLED